MERPNGAGPNGRDLGRAERFEDEKRRIIETCFNKKDVDGSRTCLQPPIFLRDFLLQLPRLATAPSCSSSPPAAVFASLGC